MFALRKQISRPKKGIKSDFSYTSSPLPVRDLLGLYGLQKDIITAGALCDAFLGDEISHSGYEAWKKALGNDYSNKICDLVVSALETSFVSLGKRDFDSDVFVLRSAILINKISRLASLSESELNEWISEVRALLKSKQIEKYQSPYKNACQDMGAYLQTALSYVSNTVTAL